MNELPRIGLGNRMDLPEGTVAFLLTDVEGSTRLWELAPHAMPEVIARHYELLDDAIAAHSGQRPQEQGEGDSIVAVFTDVCDAVDAAIDAQRALTNEAWPDGLEMRVRMAIHVGHAVKRNASNYVGGTIIRCARLRACAHGEQILLSDAAAALLRANLPDGVALSSLGSHRLKDLDAPEHVHQVVASGLRSTFPPLRSLTAGRHNLPLQSTPLLGRADDVDEVVSLLHRTRLVTLTGAGGVGKTRVALQVAADAADEYVGGVWWVDLATINDSDVVAASVLAAIGGTQPPMTSTIDQLVAVLEPETSILVVLDNCEHVADGCALAVEAMMTRCPGVVIVATSREPLGVAGEVTWRVASLSTPAVTPTVDEIETFSALALFWDRAWRARPQLTVTPALLDASVRICQRVDGIPLAIELAAARCRQLSPERIANELDTHFRVLAGGGRTQLARQRTLEASVDWSYRLLPDDEQTAFRRLAVFTGWFPLEAAEGVVAAFDDLDRWAVLDLVSRLADKSLLLVDDESDAGEPRYRMLETIRFYGLEQARNSRELEAARNAHATWWSDWLQSLRIPTIGTRALAQAQPWYPNLRDAMRWVAADLDRVTTFLRDLAALAAMDDHGDDLRFMIESAAALHASSHPQWPHTVSRLAWPAVTAGALDFLFGPVTEAMNISAANDDQQCAAECAFGLGFLDASGLTFAEASRRATLAEDHDLAAMARAGSLSLGPESMLETAAEIDELLTGPRTLDPYVRFAASVVRVACHIACGPLSSAREALEQLDAFANHLPFLAAGSELQVLAESAAVDLFSGEGADIERILHRRLDRRFRGWPTFLTGVWTEAISIAAHHLAGTSLDVDCVGAALVASMTDTGSAALRVIVSELLDRGEVAPVRTALARFRAAGHPDGSFRRLVHDTIEAHLHIAEGDVVHGEEQLRAILPPLLDQGAELLLIDALEALALLTASGSPTRARRIMRAAQAERDALGYTFRFPNHRRAVEALLAAADADDEPPMTLANVVAFALRTTGRRDRPTIGWASLTPTEREVARLVAGGATNPTIAKTLAMTVNTVKTHLSHIFTKLDIASRAQLASLVTENAALDR